MLSVAEIVRARGVLAGRVRRTFLAESASLGRIAGVPVHVKLEHHQITGSFKLRGALNAVALLTAEEKKRGIVGVSTGNHGRGLAWAAREAGVRCVICMSELVPPNKIEGIRSLGAEVRIRGVSQDAAEVEAGRLAKDGMTMVSPFDHPGVIAGQGTIGLEILEDLPEVGSVIVPVSGGGLIGGIALAVKSVRPHVRVFGVSMERGAAMHASWRAGRPVAVEELPTLADALGGGIGFDNRHTLALVREHVDAIVTLTEAEIAAAIRHAYTEEREVVEGAGAVGIGALVAGKLRPDGPVAVVVSGGNIDMALHRRLVNRTASV